MLAGTTIPHIISITPPKKKNLKGHVPLSIMIDAQLPMLMFICFCLFYNGIEQDWINYVWGL